MATQLGLPPGAQGFRLGAIDAEREGLSSLGMLGNMVGIRGALSEQALRDEQIQAREKLSMTLSAIPEIANHPVLSTIARTKPEALLPFVMPKPAGDTKLGPGEAVYGPDGKLRFQNPKEATRSPLAQAIAERDALPPGDPNRPFYDARIKHLTATEPKPPTHQVVTDANGNQIFVDTRNPTAPGMPVLGPDGKPIAKPEKALTEGQGNATMFGIRAVDMDKTLKTLQAEGYDPTTKSSALDRVASGGLLTNWMASPTGQKYMNAGKNFVAAVLRKESGAQISAQEWQDGQMLYIPMPGDQPDTLAQKARNRELSIQGLREAAGPGASRIAPTFNPSDTKKKVKRTGTLNGRKVTEYTDGSVEYTD